MDKGFPPNDKGDRSKYFPAGTIIDPPVGGRALYADRKAGEESAIPVGSAPDNKTF